MSYLPECCFCNEKTYPLKSQFYLDIGQYLNCESRIIGETHNWFAVPSFGCLTTGYVLLVSKQHYSCLAAMNRRLLFEMLDLKKMVENRISEATGMKCVSFEHGALNPLASGANSVDHVHLHVMPLDTHVWNDISNASPHMEYENVHDYYHLYEIWQKSRPDAYLLFQDLDEKIRYVPNACGMPSQHFRRILASKIGASEWDWRKELYSDNIIKTLKMFGKA